MAQHFLGAVIALASLGGWFGVYGACLLMTRPARPQPMPPTQDLGPNPEPPAVVSLLANHWELTEDAAESTLLDLGARRILEFRQPAADPMQTTVHVRQPNPTGLNAYEDRVFRRVAGIAVGGVVPLTALTFRNSAAATGFEKRLRAEVIADARARGVSQRRLNRTVVVLLSVAALAAGVGLGVAAVVGTKIDKSDDLKGIGVLVLFTTFVLAAIGGRNHGERDTGPGREVAARWLGVKAWLHNTEAFGDLPPSAVSMWDRYLAYGAAVGATRVSSAVIDMGMGNRKLVWSSFGGTWHRVRVRYPSFWARYGKPAPPLVFKALVAALIGFVILYEWTKALARLAKQSFVQDHTAAGLTDPVRVAGLVLGVILLGYGLYVLVRVVIDLAAPATITGQVLWKQVWRTRGGGEDSPPVPVTYYLAIDDGTGDRTVAWALPADLSRQCDDGDTVTITVRRWSRRIGEVVVVEHGTLGRLESSEAASSTDKTESLIALALGQPAGPGQRTMGPSGPVLTPEEVSRALGFLVTAQPRIPHPIGRLDLFNGPDGHPALMVFLISGLPAQMAIRSRRRGQQLPSIGNEAYTGDRWAITRCGESVVMLQLQGQGRNANAGYLHWLLSTAAGRLVAPGQPVT
jgi:hypothetical protein